MKAPDFSLNDKENKIYNLSEINTKYLVLYFYPKDNTPGCTIEAKEFSDNLNEFEKINARIIGISGGDNDSKGKFCDKYGLKVLLLSDPDFKVSSEYGVYGEKQFMGRKFMGISRTTFVLDKDKKIIKVYEKVKAIGHADEVLDFIKNLWNGLWIYNWLFIMERFKYNML